MWKTYPPEMWKTMISLPGRWMMWKTYPPEMWRTSRLLLIWWMMWKTYPPEMCKTYSSPIRCMKGEYFEKDEKKVPGYPQRVWITKGKSVQKRNDSLKLTGKSE